MDATSITSSLTDIQALRTSPLPAGVCSALCLASAVPGLKHLPGYPRYFPALASSALFAGSAWVISNDTENGASTATAWGLAYNTMFMADAIKARRPGPIALNLCILGSTLLYAGEMMDSLM